MSFPENFTWGAASAAYQIEGGYDEGGRGMSIWDTFSHTPGKTFNGQTGDVSCDAYHHLEEDLDLMEQLGLQAYRFSISWPRVIPDGDGAVNPEGLSYYDRLIDGCLTRGIVPWITLYHWDLPQALQDRGGWMVRSTAESFARYAGILAEHFRGRVSKYITLNEPQCSVGLGHRFGNHAPGLNLNDKDLFTVWHHHMLAHGLAAAAIRRILPDAQVGIASTGNLCYLAEHKPDSSSSSDDLQELADRTFLTAPAEENPGWFFNHQWFLDPVCTGHYPEDPACPWAALLPSVPPEDLKLIHQIPDFIALNIYNGHELHPDPESGHLVYTGHYPGFPRTALKWPVTPEVLYWGPRLVWERYHLPVVISENGQSCNDRIFLDGQVHDPDREDFLHRYLLELRAAVEDGIPVTAYFHWSLTDNYEWHSGYEERFGLIYVDYRNQHRILKDSARWYAEVIRSNGAAL